MDPTPEEARRLLEQELAKADYHRPESLVRRIADWFADRLSDLLVQVPSTQGLGTLALVAVLVLAAIAIFLAVRGTRRDLRRQQHGERSVLDEVGVSAAEYRRRAQRALSAGDWDQALLDAYRAVAAGAAERTLVDELPGRTAHEIAVGLQPRFPDHATRLSAAADAFDSVRYGGRRVAEHTARGVLELEGTLARTRPRLLEAVG